MCLAFVQIIIIVTVSWQIVRKLSFVFGFSATAKQVLKLNMRVHYAECRLLPLTIMAAARKFEVKFDMKCLLQ
jgi:hypothetical protein